MGLEDKHLDILQSIESSIVSVYRTNYQMRDNDALCALKALIDYYHDIAHGDRNHSSNLPEPSSEIFDNVKSICDMRLNDQEDAIAIVTCLQKIEKSAKRWNHRNGQRGYLEFVVNYV